MRAATKVLSCILSFLLMLVTFSFVDYQSVSAEEIDFNKNYDYYYSLCTNTANTGNLSDGQKNACSLFREYQSSRKEDYQKKYDELTKELKDIMNNIKTSGQKVAQYNTYIERLESDINNINNNITEIQNNISSLEAKIEERQNIINDINEGVKSRMAATQANVVLNNYIQFIMGADSFIDVLRRISAINEITKFDRDQIKQVEDEKALIVKDREKLQLQVDDLYTQQSELDSEKALYDQMKMQIEVIIEEMNRQEAQMEAEQEELDEDMSYLDDVISTIDMVVDELLPLDDFRFPLKNISFTVTSAFPYYSRKESSGFHTGVDYAIPRKTPLYAMGNGIVILAKDNCPLEGYYGSTCNGGRGRFVVYITEVGGKFYAINYFHLSELNVAVGDRVYASQTVVAYSGNSGSSTGAHLHLMMLEIGTSGKTNLIELVKKAKDKGFNYGVVRGYNSVCSVKHSAPCYASPEELLGYYWRNRYKVGA